MAVTYRKATKNDARLIAQLHTESWQTAYRGILTDEYLDNDIYEDRLAVWTERMGKMPKSRYILLAFEEKTPIGFICAYANEDKNWGTLIDNLHVLPQAKGKGIGRILMQRAAAWSKENYPDSGIYLWVYEANKNANAFYQAIGGKCVEKVMHDNPDGGQGMVLRYVWHIDGIL